MESGPEFAKVLSADDPVLMRRAVQLNGSKSQVGMCMQHAKAL